MIQLTYSVAKTPGTAKAAKTSRAKKSNPPKRPALRAHHEMTPTEFHKDWTFRVLGTPDDCAAVVIAHMKKVTRFMDAKYGRGKTEFPGAVVIERGWTTPGQHDDALEIDDADKLWEMPVGMCPVQIYGGMRMDPKGSYRAKIFDLLKAYFDVYAPEIALRLT